MTFEELHEANRRRKADAELADLPLLAHARTDDPATSHEAAASIHPHRLRSSQAAVLALFHQRGPMTDEQLVERYKLDPPQSPSGLRSRRAELVGRDKLKDTGRRAILKSGRRSIVWGLA